MRGANSVGGLIGSLNTGSVLSNAYASGRVTGSVIVGGLLGSQASTITPSRVYWDNYSTGQGSAAGSGTASGAIAVSSDPGVRSAYVPGSYAFTAASGIGTATPSGFVFLAGNSTRPFLAFEVPTAARFGAVPGDLASVRTIVNSHELQLIGYNAETLSGNYRLAGGIDLTETGRVGSGIAGSTDRNNTAFGAVAANTPGAYSGMWAPTGFVSLGTDGAGNVWNGSAFVAIGAITGTTYGYGGTFDGGGASLTNLTIDRPAAAYTGLFGVTNGTVRNLDLTESRVTGAGTTGALVGFLFRGGAVTGSRSGAVVRGTTYVGGMIGSAGVGTTLRSLTATGDVSGTNNVGGLIGYASGATITRSLSTARATGTNYIGGLIGYAYNTAIADSYATGAATASATSAGGLIGKILGGSVARTYSTGAVSAGTRAGGLIGAGDPNTIVTSSYWNTKTSGQSTSGGGAGRTTAELRDPATYVGWDFVNVWAPPGFSFNTTPVLRREATPAP